MRKKFMVALAVEAFIVFVVLALLGLQLLKPYTFDAVEANLREEIEARARVIVGSVAAQCIEPILDGDEVVLGLIVAKAAKEYDGMKWV